MSQTNQPPASLVHIEPLKRTLPASEPTAVAEIEIPPVTDWFVYKTKTWVTLRKVSGFFYTRHSYGAARRWVLATVLPDRILYRWRPYRQGGCNRCGLCCKIVFQCPFFLQNEETTACMIYETKHAAPPCVTFPIDPIDLAEVKRAIAPDPCPFYFEGEPEHPTTWGAVKAEIRASLGRRVDKLKEAFD
ncbi:MAG: hypothetical protein ABI882_23820 [Acidobacteriota bacterium]